MIRKITLFALVLLGLHLLLNYWFFTIDFRAVLAVQFTLFALLLFSVFYVKRKKEKEPDRVWVAYTFIVSLKFLVILTGVYFLNKWIPIPKKLAIPFVFIWFFAYLYFEVRLLLGLLKENPA